MGYTIHVYWRVDDDRQRALLCAYWRSDFGYIMVAHVCLLAWWWGDTIGLYCVHVGVVLEVHNGLICVHAGVMTGIHN